MTHHFALNPEQIEAVANKSLVESGVALKKGLLEDAERLSKRALADYKFLYDNGHSHLHTQVVISRVSLGEALWRAGRLSEALEQHHAALNGCQQAIVRGHTSFNALAASIYTCLGNDYLDAGRLLEAMSNFNNAESIFETLDPITLRGFQSQRARNSSNFGVALSRAGLVFESIEKYKNALAQYEKLNLANNEQWRSEMAATRSNFGVALRRAGRLNEAAEQHRRAVIEHQALIGSGGQKSRSDYCKARNNLGIVLSHLGRFTEAIEHHLVAVVDYRDLIEAGFDQYRIGAARNQANLGNALWRAWKVSEAISHHQVALDEYEKLVSAGQKQHLGEAVTCRTNLANSLFDLWKLPEAIKHYRDAMEEYRALIDTGQRQFRADAARTQGNLGLALSRIGDMAGAMAALDECAKAYQALVGEGQRQHILEWHRAVRQYAESALGWLLGSVVAEGVVVAEENPAQAARHHLEQAWLKLLQLEPAELDSHKLQSLEMMWKTLDEYWQARLRGEAALEQVQLPVVPVVLTWLDHAADLLSRGRPEYLAAQIDQLRPMLSGCLQMLLELGQPGAVATWHLRTQGLRAQRQVLASGAPSDPELGKLAAMLDEIDQLATILSGQHQAQSLMLPSVDGGIAMRMSALSGGLGDEGELKRQQALQARYNQLKQEADQLEALLASQGRLPKAQRMDLSLIEQGLRAGDRHDRALVLLLPHQAEQMIVCSIQADQDKPAGLHYGVHPTEAGASEVQLRQWVSQLTEAAVRDGRSVRSSLSDEELQAVAQVEPEPIAVEPLRQAWQQLPLVLRPLLARLYQQGVREVHIVPGGDWHLAPWAGTLDECEQDLRVRQYPTAASWWRVMTEPEEQPLTPSRWAALAHDAQHTRHKPLLWVPPELQALQTIWGPQQLQCLSPSEPVWPAQDQDGAQQEVHALVGLGHGGAPAGNWALAGMVIGQDADRRTRYFTALDLHRVRHATRVVMSCCVLGRVQDWIGEPMGLGALAFGLQARLAVGAVVPIADLEGSLLSMALHHAWQGEEQQCLARGQQMDWSGVFHATRRQILAGQWPQGFEQRLVQGFEQLRGPLRQALDEAANGTMPPRQYWANLARQPSPVVQHTAALTYCLG